MQNQLEPAPKPIRLGWIHLMFFFSGFPALIYQIIWQRALFGIYGVNIESVTVVVSAFMLGLGVGSLLGGFVSKRPNVPLLAVFGVAEIGIALFGIVSLRLYDEVGLFTAGSPPLLTGVITFLLVLIPTTLMGGTLPLLTAYVVRRSGNVGHSVGLLYFVNTLGSAISCFVAATVTMREFGMSGSVAFAALINAVIGSAVLILYFRTRRQLQTGQIGAPEETGSATGTLIPFPVAVAVAGLAGFISLSYEILWYRVVSYITGGQAKSFAFLLGWFLMGIAFGSLLSRRLCRDPKQEKASTVRAIGLLVVAANVTGFLVVPFFGEFVRHASYLWALPMIALAAGLLGATFPLICHVSVSPDAKAGSRLSYLYLSNIIGSASGSLVVGFVVMDIYGIRDIAVMLALLGLGLGISILLAWRGPRTRLAVGANAGLAIAILACANPLFDGIYDKFQNKAAFRRDNPFKFVVEGRSGVITVDDADVIYGGGVYDGRFSTDLVHDSNGLVRAFAVSSFHPTPRQILMVGLASGSWGQVLANHPQLEKLTIVEINPRYLGLIEHYPLVAGLLRNPKVEIVIDDGRRWLMRNPKSKFDVIVMNASFAWRAHASNLLSTDFLRLIRRHLNPGGVHFYNATHSDEALLTGATVFPYSLRVLSFLAVSDSPIVLDKERWRQTLSAYRIEGRPVLQLDSPEGRARLNQILALADTPGTPAADLPGSMETGDSLRRRNAGKRIITDDNMGIEWRR